MFLYFFCFTNILIAQNTSVTFPVNTPIDQVTGGYFSKYFENIIQRHTINGVDVLNGSCPDDYVVTGFLQPVGNVFRDKVLK